MSVLDTLLAVAAQKGCACGLRLCLIHYAEQQRQEGAGVLKKTSQGEQAEFYVTESDRNNSGRSSHRESGRKPGDTGVRRNGPVNRGGPGKAVRKPAREPKR